MDLARSYLTSGAVSESQMRVEMALYPAFEKVIRQLASPVSLMVVLRINARAHVCAGFYSSTLALKPMDRTHGFYSIIR